MIDSASHLPTLFIERLKNILLPQDYPEVLASFSTPRYTSFRINTLVTTHSAVLDDLQAAGIHPQPIAWYDDAYIIRPEQRDRLTHHPCINEGKVYIQDLASMLAPLILNPKPGESILDCAAAPGSKTTQMACLMNNQGRIAAVEKAKTRFFALRHNCQRYHADCVVTYLKDASLVGRQCPNRFDRVLVDAPCSSEARFHLSRPSSYAYWSEKKIKAMARQQWRILWSAFQALKPGGTALYSTCSFAPEENEAIVAKLLQRTDGQCVLEQIDCPLSKTQTGLTHWANQTFPDSLKHCCRILPQTTVSGFFLAKLRKLT